MLGDNLEANTGIDADISQQKNQINTIRRALVRLETINDFTSTSTSGDPDFDVELTVAINVARAALIRLKSLKVEKTGRLRLEVEDV